MRHIDINRAVVVLAASIVAGCKAGVGRKPGSVVDSHSSGKHVTMQF